MTGIPSDLDAKNATFWDELCGSSLACTLGISDVSPESLRRFDDGYLAFYPYLLNYVAAEPLEGKRVLEIGLGYGTLGQMLVSRGCHYHGLDIAEGPVAMMRYRLANSGCASVGKVRRGSALEIPHADCSFDYVYSIGCLHHTGDLPRAVSEVGRVLVPGGKAVVMLYNRHSFRQLVQVPLMRLLHALKGRQREPDFAARIRALYDPNREGEAAPHTDFVSRADVFRLFHRFRAVAIDVQNFDDYALLNRRLRLPRKWFLNNVARVCGLDFYVRATR